MGRLFNVLIAPVGYFVYIVVNRHLLGEHVNVKRNFHMICYLL